MRITAKSDCGKVRRINQDAIVARILPDGAALCIVCDGMGGANAGDVASRCAAEVISQYVLNSYTSSMDTESLLNLLKNALFSANIEVYDLAVKDESLNGMGTTAVVAIVKNDVAVVCNIGDSRAYIVNDKLTQITRDHSVVQELLESGKLTPEEARVHPKKNLITKALGVEERVFPDAFIIPIDKNDKLLLCTDGLSNYVTGDKILDAVNGNQFDKIVDILLNEANSNGGGDNITAAIVFH